MECVYLLNAKYIKDHKVLLEFNTHESGEVDLWDTVNEYEIAKQLRDPKVFSQFYLDSWPTLAWKCGFDIAPETLYLMATKKKRSEK